MSIDTDLDNVRVSTEIRVAAGLHTFSGLIAFLTGLQLVGLRYTNVWASYVPYALIASGILALYCGTQVYRGKLVPSVIAASLAGFHFFGGGAWCVVILLWGVGSLIAMFTPIVALGALALGVYVLPEVARIQAAKRRLARQGFAFGF